MKKRLLSFLLTALMVCMSLSINAFAEDYSATYGENNSSSSPIVPYGVLSGYAQHNHSTNSSPIGSFTINVTGSWSPYAGWTLKTDFSSNSKFEYVYLTRPDGTQIGNTLYPNSTDELSNKVLTNVPTGTYTVHYKLSSNGSGTMQVWIY